MGTESDPSNTLEMPRWYQKLLVPSVRNRKGHTFLLTGETTVLNTETGIKAGDFGFPLERFLLGALAARPILVVFNSRGEVEIKLTDEAKNQHAAVKRVALLRDAKTFHLQAFHAMQLLDESQRAAVVIMEVDEATAAPRCSEREAEQIWSDIYAAAKSDEARRNGALLLLQSSQRDLPKTPMTSIGRMETDLSNWVESIPVERPTFEERLRCFRLCLPPEDESFFRRFALDSHGWPLDKLGKMLQTAQRSTKAAGTREAIIHRLCSYEEGFTLKSFFAERPSTPTRASTLIHGHPHVARYAQTVRELMEATTQYQPHLLRIVGTPGNGKALAAEAIACELGARFVRLKPTALRGALDTLDRRIELRDTLIALAPIVVFTGEDVRTLQALFRGYQLSAPVVIVSGISSKEPLRDGTFMQGMHECLVIPPFSQEERCDVIEAFCRDAGHEKLDEPTLQEIGRRMPGYTFDEIARALTQHPWLLTPFSTWGTHEQALPAAKTILTMSDELTLYGLLWTKEPEHLPQHPRALISMIMSRSGGKLDSVDRERVAKLLKQLS